MVIDRGEDGGCAGTGALRRAPWEANSASTFDLVCLDLLLDGGVDR